MPARTMEDAFEEARTLDAPLGERLAAYAQSLRELNTPLAEGVDRLVARLKDGSVAATAPNVGEKLPSFTLPDQSGRIVALENMLSAGPVVVAFARGHWCPYCRIALDALARISADVTALGANIVAILPDRQAFTTLLRNETKAPYSILSDVDNGYALSLGLVFWVGEEVKRLMQARGADPATSQGNDLWFLPVPATFVVARDGTIVARHVDPDYRKRMEVDEILAALRDAAAR